MKKKNRETLFRHIENFPIFILSFHSNERHKRTLIFLADEKSLIVVAVHLLYVNGLHQAFALCYRRLFKSLTCTQFFHDAGLFIFSFELFQSSLDVLTFFYLYDYHCFIVFNCFLKLCFEITATNITGMETAPQIHASPALWRPGNTTRMCYIRLFLNICLLGRNNLLSISDFI